ncbi:hypothetical protein Ccrd_018575 [Cynara cardunculus var. scolymus]|uniref:Uncharacterized protein n=1 Tax=Cynara cardunculus var. scolymus TaxID=59895 RepID=A0A103Y5X6_CYNCS|nr:hypothetical protein Ccrd_018575 [Cynara cardunculus var. scolymus]
MILEGCERETSPQKYDSGLGFRVILFEETLIPCSKRFRLIFFEETLSIHHSGFNPSLSLSRFLLFGDHTQDDVLGNFDGDLGIPYSSMINDVGQSWNCSKKGQESVMGDVNISCIIKHGGNLQ